MSNKTQLSTNNTQLASLIQTLQGKATGGGIDTCSVRIIPDADATVYIVGYTYVDNDGKITSIYNDYNNGFQGQEITLNNLVCGSYIYVCFRGINVCECRKYRKYNGTI